MHRNAETNLQCVHRATYCQGYEASLTVHFYNMTGTAAAAASGGGGGAATQQEEEDTRAAVKAVMAGLALGSDGEADVAFGILRVPLMRHQRMALAWMLKREEAEPSGEELKEAWAITKGSTRLIQAWSFRLGKNST